MRRNSAQHFSGPGEAENCPYEISYFVRVTAMGMRDWRDSFVMSLYTFT